MRPANLPDDAVRAYTIPGLKPGDPPIVVAFQRAPEVVMQAWARAMRAPVVRFQRSTETKPAGASVGNWRATGG